MAEKVRVQRVAEQIRGELSQILRDEIRDPRLPLLTITRVKLAVDLGAATIFYSPLGEDPDEARAAELQQVMAKVTGYVRRALSKRVKLRHTPELRWVQGTPRTWVGITGDERQGGVFVIIDNLGKGAAGQAIQNMNCMLGIDETVGLMSLPGGFV